MIENTVEHLKSTVRVLSIPDTDCPAKSSPSPSLRNAKLATPADVQNVSKDENVHAHEKSVGMGTDDEGGQWLSYCSMQ